MDGSRFDTWTRRKFGLAAGGAAVTSLLSLAGIDDADARRRRGRRRRPQCRKLGQTCNESNKDQRCCNSSQLCAQVPDLGTGNFCCKQVGEFCDTSSDCCGRDACDFSTGRCRSTR